MNENGWMKINEWKWNNENDKWKWMNGNGWLKMNE